MYCLAEIDEGGFIQSEWDTIHKESLLPFGGMETYTTLAEAKESLVRREHPVMLLSFPRKNTCATTIWCFPDQEELIRERLKIWSGCYGAWPIRRLNAPVPLSR